MKTTRIAVLGAGGRMGAAIIKCAVRATGIKLVAAIEQQGHPSIGKDAGEVSGIAKCGVKISSNLRAMADAAVAIDFTLHTAVAANARLAAELGKPMVIGTTGLDNSESAAVRAAAARVPIVWAPNMSLGVNLLFAMVSKAASVLGPDYHVEIEETHHVHKKDAPSGTALRLGERIAAGRGVDFRTVMQYVDEESDAPAQPGKITIRSHRIGEVVGDHTVVFKSDGETVELTHHAWSRDAFALGALCAARWVVSQAPGLYDMQTVLGL